jgi:hypothetical protein
MFSDKPGGFIKIGQPTAVGAARWNPWAEPTTGLIKKIDPSFFLGGIVGELGILKPKTNGTTFLRITTIDTGTSFQGRCWASISLQSAPGSFIVY